MSTRTLGLAVLGLVGLWQPSARAQAVPVCSDGRLMNEDTKGQCCWPDQVWSTMRRICVGIPRCPYGMTPQGEQCVPGFPVAVPPASALPPPPILPEVRAKMSPPPEGTFPVIFEPYHKRHHYTVTMDGKSCETPCRLFVRPGEQRMLTVGGRHEIEETMQVPNGPSRVVLLHGMHDTVIAGTVLLTVSAGMMIVGNVAFGIDYKSGLVPAAIFGWGIGPVAHVAGIITLAVGLGRLRSANKLHSYMDPYAAAGGAVKQPTHKRRPELLSAGVSPTGNGLALGVSFRY